MDRLLDDVKSLGYMHYDDKLELDMSPMLKRSEELVGDREHYLLFLKTACGMGVTEMIMTLVKQSRSFIIITGGILLGRKLYDDCFVEVVESDYKGNIITEKINIATFYSALKRKLIESKRTIVTIDSLHRVIQKYEYLILFDVSYILSQLVTRPYEDDKSKISKMLTEMIRYIPKVLAVDTCLKQETLDMLKKIRERDDTVTYRNQYPNQQDKEVYVLDNSRIFYDMIGKSVANGDRIIIPSGCSYIAKSIGSYMVIKLGCVLYREHETPAEGETRYKVKIYTEEDNFSMTEWHAFDCIIYDSILEPGISYTSKHFDKCYGYFMGKTSTPYRAIHMLLVCRKLSTGKIYILVIGNGSTDIPFEVKTLQDVKDYVRADKDKIREELIKGILFTYEGGIEIDYDSAYFDIFCDVKYREMIGKRNYLDNLLYYCKEQGMRFGAYINNEAYQEILGYNDEEYFSYMKTLCSAILETLHKK